MQFTVITNQAQAQLRPGGGAVTWQGSYDQPQLLTIQAKVDDYLDVGQTVGLVQIVLESTRTAFYGEEATLVVTPPPGVPCLDADQETIPFYNSLCEGKFEKLGDQLTLTLNDSPVPQVPAKAKNGNTTVSISRFVVDEKFLVSLYMSAFGEIVKQWTWGYTFTLVPSEKDPLVPTQESSNTGPMQDNVLIQTQVVQACIAGPTATGGAVTTAWTPGWGPASPWPS